MLPGYRVTTKDATSTMTMELLFSLVLTKLGHCNSLLAIIMFELLFVTVLV